METLAQRPARITRQLSEASAADRLAALIGRVPLFNLAIFVLFLLFWQFSLTIFHVSYYLLPKPTDVSYRLILGFTPSEPTNFYRDIAVTCKELFVGFALASIVGLFAGLAMARMPRLERVLYPYLFALQAIPMIALAPLLIIWLGYGMASKAAISLLCAFFPMMVASLAAFKAVDKNHAEMFRALCASRTQTFLKLSIPSALPILLAGLDLSLVHALVGAIVGEFVGGQEGLGVRLLTYNSSIDVAGSFAILVVLCALGVALHSVLIVARNKYLAWMPSATDRRTSTTIKRVASRAVAELDERVPGVRP